MTKKVFLNELNEALRNDPERLDIIKYYEELIEDAVYNGEKEEDIVKRLGSVRDIILTMGKTYEVKKKQNIEFKPLLNGLLVFGLVLGLIVLISIFLSSVVALTTTALKLNGYDSPYIFYYYVSQMVIAFGLILITFVLGFKVVRKIQSLIYERESRGK